MSDIVERAQAHLAYYKSSYAVERGHVTDEPELFSGLLAEIERLRAENKRLDDCNAALRGELRGLQAMHCDQLDTNKQLRVALAEDIHDRTAVLRFIDGLMDGEIRNTIGKAFGSTLPTGLLHLNGDAFRAALRKLAEEERDG